MKQREKWSMSQVLSAQDPVWDLNGVTIDKTCHDGAGAGVSVVPVPGAGNKYCYRHSLLLWKCQIILSLEDLYFFLRKV